MKIEKIKSNYPIKKLLDEVRRIGREIINIYFSDSIYTEQARENELKFFGEDLDFLRNKWVLEIIWELETYKELTYNMLKRKLKGISSRTLSVRLKEFEKIDIITREVQDTRPISVLYKLTEKGKGFAEITAVSVLYLKAHKF